MQKLKSLITHRSYIDLNPPEKIRCNTEFLLITTSQNIKLKDVYLIETDLTGS